MHKLTLAAAAAALAFTGTAASAQMDQTRTTTTTQTMQHPMGTMEKTTTRTHTANGSMNGTMPRHMAMKSKRHCKTWWSHGKKMRSCKMMKRHQM